MPQFRKNFGINLFLNQGSCDKDKLKYAAVNERLSCDYRLRKLGTTALELCYVGTDTLFAKLWF